MLYFLKIDRVNAQIKENLPSDWVLSTRYLAIEKTKFDKKVALQECGASIFCNRLDEQDRILG